MARFVKTRLHVVSAVALLLVAYAVAGLLYALWVRSTDSVAIWAAVAVVALVVAIGNQSYVAKKRRRTP